MKGEQVLAQETNVLISYSEPYRSFFCTKYGTLLYLTKSGQWNTHCEYFVTAKEILELLDATYLVSNILGFKVGETMESKSRSQTQQQFQLPSYLTVLRDLFAAICPTSSSPKEKYDWADAMIQERNNVSPKATSNMKE